MVINYNILYSNFKNSNNFLPNNFAQFWWYFLPSHIYLCVCFKYIFVCVGFLAIPLTKDPGTNTPWGDRTTTKANRLWPLTSRQANADACRWPHKSFAFDLRQGRFINKLRTAALEPYISTHISHNHNPSHHHDTPADILSIRACHLAQRGSALLFLVSSWLAIWP